MPSFWVVVGGADRGGVIVRRGAELSSETAEERLSHAALVEELELQGERLRYRLTVGDGPKEGWISTRLKNKELAVRMFPEALSRGMTLEAAARAGPPEMTFFAISDVHMERRENLAWLQALPKVERSAVLIAGDLGVSLTQVDTALRLFKEKFDHVFYCFGNHETWSKVSIAADKAIASYADSFEKLEALRKVCDNLNVITAPRLLAGVWVVPILGWYHSDWDREPDLQPPAGGKLDRQPPAAEDFATDTHACQWGEFKNGSRELASRLDQENEAWGCWPLPEGLLDNLNRPRESRLPVISFSHFLPRIEVMPEKRFLFQPNLPKIVGSDFVRRRMDAVQPDVHVFGHSHFPWDMTLDGVRYRSWPLGTPEEQARRIVSLPTAEVEDWRPMPIFDSDGNHYRSSEICWFSLMYTRIAREPESSVMAGFVAEAWCRDAPTLPVTFINPHGCLEPSGEEDRLRRERYMAKSNNSVKKEVGRARVLPE